MRAMKGLLRSYLYAGRRQPPRGSKVWRVGALAGSVPLGLFLAACNLGHNEAANLPRCLKAIAPHIHAAEQTMARRKRPGN